MLKNLEVLGAMLRALLRIALLIAWFVLSLVQQTAGFLLGTGDGRHLRLRFYRGLYVFWESVSVYFMILALVDRSVSLRITCHTLTYSYSAA